MAVYGRMIKFEHSIFALPFALSALLLAHRVSPVTPRLIFLIIFAVITARSAGMGFNQLVDAHWDAKNPRTAGREIPAGRISAREAGIFIFISGLLFVLSALAISRLCFFFSLPVLLILFSYSYAKRYTWLCHRILGFTQALGPMGVWVAVTDDFSHPILVLSLALGTYIAGFDLLYACQDTDFDRSEGLYSIPANLGIRRAMAFSIVLHVITFSSLLSLYWFFSLTHAYLAYVLIIGLLLIVEHKIVNHDDMARNVKALDYCIINYRMIFIDIHLPVIIMNIRKNTHKRGLFFRDLLRGAKVIDNGIVIFYDDEVNIFDDSLILWKLFNNVDPRRDLFIDEKLVIIDATVKSVLDGHHRPWPDELINRTDIKQRVDSRWREYGLASPAEF